MIAGACGVVLLCLAALLAIPVAVFACECLLGAAWREHRPREMRPPGKRAVVLIPAHDEEAGIKATLDALRPELGPDDRVLVVADNCSDKTAEVARSLGAQVAERHDQRQPGKGFALAFGADHIASWTPPPDVVVVLDSDCRFSPGSVQALVTECLARECAVQCDDELVCPPDATTKAKIGAFAFRVKNTLRARGLDCLRLPRQLAGTGMAFPWETFRDAPNVRGWITEDLVLGLELALRGSPSYLCAGAKVESEVAPTSHGQTKQRQRWEHGHLSAIARYAPRLLWAAFRQRRFVLLALAVDLSVPPLALLTALVMGLGAACLVAGFAGAGFAPAITMAVEAAALCAAVTVAWLKVGRGLLSAADIARIPLYMLGKLPSYTHWLRGKGDKRWVRAERRDGAEQ